MLGNVKSILRDQLGVPTWLVLVVVGCLAHALLNAALRRPLSSPWGLFGPLALGIAIEAYEIWAHYRHAGLFAPGSDPLPMILGRHSLDVLVMIALPGAFVAASAIVARPS